MTITNRLALGAMVAAAMTATVVGCSNPATSTSSASATTTAYSASASNRPMATSTAPHSPKPQPPGPLDPIDTTIAAQGDDTTVSPGGPPLRFTVTMVNNGPDIPEVGMVVSLGHCSCGRGGAAMMPSGSMHMLDPQSNAWVEVPYDTEGTGMDYITETLVPPFPLTHGQTVTYQLEMALDADPDGNVKAGKGGINVTPTVPSDPMRYGFRYAKFLPITVAL